MRLFLFFAEEDRELKDELLKHLAVFRALGEVQTWSADSVQPGDDWAASAEAAIGEVDAALVLLSADFLAGELAKDARAPELMERLRSAGRPIIPVLLRSCLWQHHPWLAELKALPKDGEAISAHEGDARDRVFVEVVSTLVESLSERRVEDPGVSPSPRVDDPGVPPVSRVEDPGASPGSRVEDPGASPGSVAARQTRTRGSNRTLLLGGAGVVLALAAGLVGWRFLKADPRPSPIHAEERPGCPAGRQMYEGACVADKMVDLLVCLKQNSATSALSRAEEVIRERPSNGTDHADARVSREVSMKFAELSSDERRLILQLCKEAADGAGVVVSLPKPAPSPKTPPTATTSTTTIRAPTQLIPRSPPSPACKGAFQRCEASSECCEGLSCVTPPPTPKQPDPKSHCAKQ